MSAETAPWLLRQIVNHHCQIGYNGYRLQAFWRSGSGQSPYLFAMLSGGRIGIASSLAGLLCLLILETILPKALWGLGHYLNGGLAHGISAALGGAFFSTAYMLMRAHGYLPACLSSYSAHMTHNFLLLFVFG